MRPSLIVLAKRPKVKGVPPLHPLSAPLAVARAPHGPLPAPRGSSEFATAGVPCGSTLIDAPAAMLASYSHCRMKLLQFHALQRGGQQDMAPIHLIRLTAACRGSAFDQKVGFPTPPPMAFKVGQVGVGSFSEQRDKTGHKEGQDKTALAIN